MENFRVTREQILKYNMQDEFPEVFKLETHRWYIVSHPSERDAIIFLQEEGMTDTFGFNHDGEWTDFYANDLLHSRYRNDVVRPATNEEIGKALIDEATRRGVFDNGEWANALELTTEQRLERIEKHFGIWNQ